MARRMARELSLEEFDAWRAELRKDGAADPQTGARESFAGLLDGLGDVVS